MTTPRGFITLLSVLLIGAIGFSIGATLLWFGVGTGKSSLAIDQSNAARGLAAACVEDALEQIRETTDFSGSSNLVLGQGTCGYTVAKLAGENRQITSVGTIGTIARKVKVSLDAINPQINLTSWQEVADF